MLLRLAFFLLEGHSPPPSQCHMNERKRPWVTQSHSEAFWYDYIFRLTGTPDFEYCRGFSQPKGHAHDFQPGKYSHHISNSSMSLPCIMPDRQYRLSREQRARSTRSCCWREVRDQLGQSVFSVGTLWKSAIQVPIAVKEIVLVDSH